jgi:DNA polymerase IV
MKLAKRLCPHMIIVNGDMEAYSKYSKLITQIIADSVPLYEKSSIDEFYIDLSGMDKYFGCVQYTGELKQRIVRESGLPISYGLSSNKMVSKVATGQGKPNGQMTVPFGTEKGFLAPLPVRKIPMVGAKTSELLVRMGVETVGVLSQIPEAYLVNLLGKHGYTLHKRAQGIDDSPVVPYEEQKSISTEETFERDTIDLNYIQSELARMCERVSYELRKHDKLCSCITVKIRYSSFDTFTKQCTIAYTGNTQEIYRTVHQLFYQLYDRRLSIRLIGVRLSHLVHGNYQINLFSDTQEQIKLYQAIDNIKQRFGADTLMSARSISNKHSHHSNYSHYSVTSFGAKPLL